VQIQQVLVNLVRNAVDAMASDAREGARRELVVATRAAGGGAVELGVADPGPGLAPEVAAQLFEPFVTTKEIGQGTGLGLAVCARLIEGMGGIIRADAGQQTGATFRIVLPVTHEDGGQAVMRSGGQA